MIKLAELHTLWAAPDNSRLTRRQYSFRLPVHVAAKLAALGDIYPNRTRTELVGDLLASALDAVEQSLPFGSGDVIGVPSDRQECVRLEGRRGVFQEQANAHYRELERELGTDKPGNLY